MKKPMKRLPLPRCIFIDVDGTLVQGGAPNDALIAWARNRREDGFTLVLWSMRGADYARNAAVSCGCEDVFSACIGKPGLIVDDLGAQWAKGIPCVLPIETVQE